MPEQLKILSTPTEIARYVYSRWPVPWWALGMRLVRVVWFEVLYIVPSKCPWALEFIDQKWGVGALYYIHGEAYTEEPTKPQTIGKKIRWMLIRYWL